PCHSSIGADAYQWPPMFSAMPSVHCSGPSHPGGVMSGQRPGPSCFENSTCMPFGRISTTRIAVVIGQLGRVSGELRIVAELNGIMSAAAAVGVGAGAGADGDGEGEASANRRSVEPSIGPMQPLPLYVR